MVALAVALGLLVGLTLGAVGAGGSILTVPLLVYALGVDVHSATGTSLLIVGTNAMAGSAIHARNGRVMWREAFTFGAVGAVGAVAGSLLNHRLPGEVILGGLAVLMLIVAVRMWQQRGAEPGPGERRSWPVVAIAGVSVGVLTGLFGVGGGFLLVPALVLVLGLPMMAAVATSLPVIAMSSAAGLLPYVAAGRVDYTVAVLFIAGGLVGMVAGTWVGERAGHARLRETFATLMVVVAGYLILQQAMGYSA